MVVRRILPTVAWLAGFVLFSLCLTSAMFWWQGGPLRRQRTTEQPASVAGRLAKAVEGLSAASADTPVAAAEIIRSLGPDGEDDARALCQAIATHRDESRVACLDALKAVSPELHPHVEDLALDRNLQRHNKALQAIAAMGTRATPAVPFLLSYHSQLPTNAATLTGLRGSGLPGGVYPSLELAVLKALAAAAPLDPATRPAFVAALRPVVVPGRRGQPQTREAHSPAARKLAIEGLVRTASPGFEADTVKELRALLSDSAIGTDAIRAVPRLGVAAKEALPDLRKLRTSSVREVRDAAAAAIEKIETGK